MPGPQSTAQHGDDSRYRAGCRCTDCREAHRIESHRWKRERRYGPGAPMGPDVRREILRLLKATRSVMKTAVEVGVTYQAIYAACAALPEFGDQVDELTQAQDA